MNRFDFVYDFCFFLIERKYCTIWLSAVAATLYLLRWPGSFDPRHCSSVEEFRQHPAASRSQRRKCGTRLSEPLYIQFFFFHLYSFLVIIEPFNIRG